MIVLEKLIMVIELKEQDFIMLPKRLSQEWLPSSMRYYDSMIGFINESVNHVPEEQRLIKNISRSPLCQEV